jgi:hypothetical protein
MSINPETDLNLDELFQPAWAKESAKDNRFERYEPRERPERGERRGPPGRRDTGDRPRRGPREGGREGGRERREFSRRDRPGGPPREGWGRPTEHREPPPPLPELEVAIQTDEKGAESLARQIRMTGRAYPLFDIAAMILQKPDRYLVVFSVKKNPEGQPLQPLYACALDETVWLSQDEAVAHVLRAHLGTFYQAERTQTDPPKGTYTFVAQCGLSGVILGPPNHHDYQAKLRDLHARRFARMPFEVYKSRVKIVRDEAVVKQWVEEQSWRTEYVCLNVPEPLKLPDLEAVEKHFREVHLPVIITQVERHALPGTACPRLRGGLFRLYRGLLDQQRRFPMQVATSLSQQFAARGLQFFKVNKTVTHVWVARPTFLDLENEPVSENVRRIVEFINAHPKCTRRQLIETLAPSPTAPVAQTQAPVAPAEGAPASAEGQPGASAVSVSAAEPQPTPEQTAVISDLHWLVHQGHVIEFANGTLETAKKPVPRPAKTEKAKKPAEPASAESAPPESTPPASSGETTPGPAAGDTVQASEPQPAPTAAPISATADTQEPAAPVTSSETAPASQVVPEEPKAASPPPPPAAP